MRVLVLGAMGMLGHQLLRRWHGRFELVATLRGDLTPHEAFLDRFPKVDFFGGVKAHEFSTVESVLAEVRPDVVVNAIGIVKQRPAAVDAISSICINALFPHMLAHAATVYQYRLIHISTDCVFSGTRGEPYRETDNPDPVDLYGRSKLLGEVADPGCLTLRTSIIGRELRERAGLVEWFLSQKGQSVRGFARALYSGLSTLTLCELLTTLIEQHPALTGLWQVAGPDISKYDLLRLLDQAFDLQTTIARDETFVCDRRLDGSRFAAEVGFQAPDWPSMVSQLAADRAWYEA